VVTNANRNDADVKNDRAVGSRFRRTKVSERVREEGEQKGEREREEQLVGGE